MLLITISKITKWGKQGNTAKLTQALFHENDEIRKAAALTLGLLGDPNSINSLTQAIEKEENNFVRKDIESALTILRSKELNDNNLDEVSQVVVIRKIRPIELKLDYKVIS